jgi:hypothetical protein
MRHRPRIGIQGSVLGWDDPFNPETTGQYMRTGEQKHFPSQDPGPRPEELIPALQELGADFYLHHPVPEQKAIASVCGTMKDMGFAYMLGNEVGSINFVSSPGSNRMDFPPELLQEPHAEGGFLGLVYDETEHLQLHPDIYRLNYQGNPADLPLHQWAQTAGRSLEEIEETVVQTVRRVLGNYGSVPAYAEQVFPVMTHVLARGGFNPCPKLLKEEFQSLQLATSLGAARQYRRGLGICVDLWGPDVGPWFTRLWGFPGHSPAEYRSALQLGYLMGPDLLFTENVDPLCRFDGRSFRKTEFGDIHQEFVRSFIPEHPLDHSHRDFHPRVALVRSDDCDWNAGGGFGGHGLYGSLELQGNDATRSPFDAFHLLSGGRIHREGLTFWSIAGQFATGRYERNDKTVGTLPLEHGVAQEERSRLHGLAHPLPELGVYDDQVDEETLGDAEFIILAGSRISDASLRAIQKRAQAGAKVLALSSLVSPRGIRTRSEGEGYWLVVDSLLSDDAREFASPWIARSDSYSFRFGARRLIVDNPSGDGENLAFHFEPA